MIWRWARCMHANASLKHDMLLIFNNCHTFNDPSSQVYSNATKLLNYLSRHLPISRALVLPPSAFESPAPPTPSSAARSPSVQPSDATMDGGTASNPSTTAATRGPSAAPSPAASTPGPARGIGQGQLGKKRGPYKKSGNAVMMQADSSSTAKPLPGPMDEKGELRGMGMREFQEEIWDFVGWWETKGGWSLARSLWVEPLLTLGAFDLKGKRIKTKKEILKLSTHPDFIHVLPDSSRNTSERASSRHLSSRSALTHFFSRCCP